jgi:hypothetical protein
MKAKFYFILFNSLLFLSCIGYIPYKFIEPKYFHQKTNLFVVNTNDKDFCEILYGDSTILKYKKDITVHYRDSCHYFSPNYCLQLYANHICQYSMCYCKGDDVVITEELRSKFKKAKLLHKNLTEADIKRTVDSINSNQNCYLIKTGNNFIEYYQY